MVDVNHPHYTGEKKMKKVFGAVKAAVIAIIVAGFMVSAFFGAVLQESYKLCPLTAAEVQEYGN